MARITNVTIEEYIVLLVALREARGMYDKYMNGSLADNNFKEAEYWRARKETAEELLKEVESLYE